MDQVSENANWQFSFDAVGLQPLTVGSGRLEEGAYAVKTLKAVQVPKKNNPSESHIKITVQLTEAGFEGIERDLYLQFPKGITAGMSDEEVRKHRFFARGWITLLQSVGYPASQITGTLSPNASVIVGRTAYINVEVEEEPVKDTFGNVVIENGAPRTRRSENRNFCTPDDYGKHRVKPTAKTSPSTTSSNGAVLMGPAVPQGFGALIQPPASGLPGLGAPLAQSALPGMQQGLAALLGARPA